MLDKDYIQYSKRFTKWGMIMIGVVMILCLGIIALCGLPQYAIQSIVSLYSAFATVLGITIGAYQGNSSLEKWTRAKYQYDELMNNPVDFDGDDGNG